MLADIHGKPMIIRVMEKALMSYASRVIVATDHQLVFDIV
ncbi:MAG: cytidylyltransferase domain-containing protein, partial [Arsenophonus sp. ER-EMS1-MAG3]